MMPGGRINTKDELQSWKPDPTRPMLPPEPNYGADAERFADRQRIKAEKKKIKELQARIKGLGGRGSKILIKDLNFTITHYAHRGEQFGYVLKKDQEFIRNMLMSGLYEIGEEVARVLLKRKVIK